MTVRVTRWPGVAVPASAALAYVCMGKGNRELLPEDAQAMVSVVPFKKNVKIGEVLERDSLSDRVRQSCGGACDC